MAFTTTFFFMVGGTICLIVSFFLFASYFKIKRLVNLSLAFVPFWIAIHSYAFALPNIVSPGDLKLLGLGYIVGTAAIFLVQLSGLEVEIFMTKHVTNIKSIIWGSILITTVALITLGIMIYDFRTPIINESGIIFWNVNPIAQWFIGLSSLIYGLVWTHVFYKAAVVVQDNYSHFRLIIISISGTTIGLVGLLVHTSSSELQTLIGHILFVISGIMLLSIFIIPKRLFYNK